MPPHTILKSIELKGFMSFDAEGQTIELDPVTIMLGANGAGKSNFISFLKMLNYMTTGGLQQYIAERGFADSLLYFGAKTTTEIAACLQFESDRAEDRYAFELRRDATDRLFFQDETIEYHAKGKERPQVIKLGGGAKESQLNESAIGGDPTCKIVHDLLSKCRVFQFHDTSATAHIRSVSYIDDNKYLRDDGGNLAAFLRNMQQQSSMKPYYDRIVRRIRQLMPQFSDFDLEPSSENTNYVRLNWRETGRDYLFGPHQLSDGSLRFMALTALFMQPPALRPTVIIVDEPELGLHPAAISALADMIKASPPESQVILSTQSPGLVDAFAADQIRIVERDIQRPRTIARRLNPEDLKEWLEAYCLSDLWEKNVLGGRP